VVPNVVSLPEPTAEKEPIFSRNRKAGGDWNGIGPLVGSGV
jgi:hypothetical protein